MLGGLSLAKILIWGGMFLLPGKREHAGKELQSNLDVVKICLNPDSI
jgi:hypothetical protein